MRTYEVTEVEESDWESLKHMPLQEALDILESGALDGYLGSYDYGSTNTYHFSKAKLYYAIDVVCEAAIKQQSNRWIPISESLPDDGETIICTDGAYMYIIEFHADWDAPFADLDGIKAWMYAPKMPK